VTDQDESVAQRFDRSEMALAVCLMICAGLWLRLLCWACSRRTGFHPYSVDAARIWLPVPNSQKAEPYAGLLRPRACLFRGNLRRLAPYPELIWRA